MNEGPEVTTIEEEVPIFLTGAAFGGGAVMVFITVPLVFYVRKKRKGIGH